MNKKNKELSEKFISILLTALISAAITFLQSLLIEPNASVNIQEQITQAGVIGSGLRSIQEFYKYKLFS